VPPKPIRVQGAFISDAEIEQLVTFIKNQNTTEPKYDESIQQSAGESSGDTAGFFEDELMPQAIDMVLETGQASSSMLQRRFRVGFTRAARMIDTMEAMGIVGPNEGNKKPREIIMSPAEVQAKFFHKDT
jgi:S-DNA-T family DNA segregation ATPase FtsK/SpoIIIE